MDGKQKIYHGHNKDMKQNRVINTTKGKNSKDSEQKLKSEFQDEKAILQNVIKANFDEELYYKWINLLDITDITKNEVSFSAPSKFVRDWVTREFIENKKSSNNLLKAIKKYSNSIKRVAVVSDSESDVPQRTITKKKSKLVSLSKHDNVFSFGTELNQKFNFDNFVSAKYNRFALKMAKIAAGVDNSQLDLFDDAIPLFIHGGVGMGKTHLAQAIAWHIKGTDANKKVVYLSAEKFMFHFVKSVRSNDMMNFKEQFRSVDVLIIDDVQFIAGKKSTQEEFMHSFNHLVENNKQVILVCDRSPSDLESIDEKLKSRISGGMILNFKKPDFNDRINLLKEKAKMMNLDIEENILEAMANKLKLSIRDLDGALRKIAARSILEEEEVTQDMADTIIKEYDNNESLDVSTKSIKKVVANHFNVKTALLSQSNRMKDVARARQVAMYLSKAMTNLSYPKIGKDFNKNHATVLYAVKAIEKEMANDSNFSNLVEKLKIQITGTL